MREWLSLLGVSFLGAEYLKHYSLKNVINCYSILYKIIIRAWGCWLPGKACYIRTVHEGITENHKPTKQWKYLKNRPEKHQYLFKGRSQACKNRFLGNSAHWSDGRLFKSPSTGENLCKLYDVGQGRKLIALSEICQDTSFNNYKYDRNRLYIG